LKATLSFRASLLDLFEDTFVVLFVLMFGRKLLVFVLPEAMLVEQRLFVCEVLREASLHIE
jgi:hypothetical protein